MSQDELQRLTRRYTIELLPVIGPEKDIPAPDMATNEQTMAWMMDTYSMQVGYAVPEVVTGKPISIGAPSSGRGDRRRVVMVTERMSQARLGRRRAGVRRAGLRERGRGRGAELAARGAKVLAVSDISGGVYSPRGLDVERLTDWVKEHGALADYPDVDHVSNSELLELPCDILVLAALEEQLTAENAPRVQCKLVAEGANGPTTIEADEILGERDRRPAGHPHERRRGYRFVLSGCRISAGSSGTARRFARSWPTS